jgi:hypothetical protein
MPVILAAQEAEVQSQSRLIVHKTPSQKCPPHKSAGRVTQEHLPSKSDVLSSHPSAAKKRIKTQTKNTWLIGKLNDK